MTGSEIVRDGTLWGIDDEHGQVSRVRLEPMGAGEYELLKVTTREDRQREGHAARLFARAVADLGDVRRVTASTTPEGDALIAYLERLHPSIEFEAD